MPTDEEYDDELTAWRARRGTMLIWLAETEVGAVGMLIMVVFTRMPKPRPGRTGPIRASGATSPACCRRVLPRQRRRAQAARRGDRAGRRPAFARLVLSPSERSVRFYARACFGLRHVPAHASGAMIDERRLSVPAEEGCARRSRPPDSAVAPP